MRKQQSIVVLLVSVLSLTGCRRQAQEQGAAADARIPVELQAVRVQPRQRSVEVVGTLYGDVESLLAAKVPGRVVVVAHDVGDTVEAGAQLARVDAADYELTVAQREAALRAVLAELGLTELPAGDFDPEQVPTVTRARIEADNADARWRRAEAMFAEKPPLITEQEHADLHTASLSARALHAAAATEARARVAVAGQRNAELAQARQMLADTAITAPPGGPWRVGRRLASIGDYVKEGTSVFALVDSDPIKFRADVPERWSSAVRIGQQVSVQVPAQQDPLTGEILRIAPIADARKRSFQVEITISNAEGALLPGGFARGHIHTHVDPAVVFVPQDAVVTALGLAKVFTVADGVAVEHRIVTGQHDGSWLEVTQSDLAPDAAVVTSGAARLAPGVAVRINAEAGGGK